MARCFLSQNDSFYLESLPIPNFPSPSHHSLYYTDRNGLDEAPNHFQEPKINIYQRFLGRRSKNDRKPSKILRGSLNITCLQCIANATFEMQFWSRSYNSNLDQKYIYDAFTTHDNEQFQTPSWTVYYRGITPFLDERILSCKQFQISG